MNTHDTEDEKISQRIELYAAAHPGTPSAVRRPAVFCKSGTWIALLGDNLEEGIIGYGDTIEAALRSFDARYLSMLHAPGEADDRAA